MPFLPEVTEKLDKIFLPSTDKLPDDEKAWVVMDISPLLTGDSSNVESDAKNQGEAAMQMLAARIREWNFTERDGTPIPITFEAMKRMSLKDFGHLQEAIEEGEGELNEDEKKASSAPLSQPETATSIPVTSQ